ncbi:MAG: family 16 glycosylhydrolase [Pseudomonadota bacterium]
MRGRFGRPQYPRLGFGFHILTFTGLCAIWLGAAHLIEGGQRDELSEAPDRISTDLVRRSHPGDAGAAFVKWFSDGHDESRWYRSDFDLVENIAQVGWSAEHISFDKDSAHLWITDKPSPTNPYTSGEYQKRGWYSFGRFEVVMKAAKGSGLVSSFFTHTGPYFDDPHDEIDFEFLGKDTNRVWLNWFSNGQAGEAKWHELGFDAAEAFHHYAFEWTPDTIRWFVDGVLVYERPEGSRPVPVTPGRIIVNLWTGREAQFDWHGEPNFDVASHASYQCISFRALDDLTSPQCSDGWPLPTTTDPAEALQVATR